MAPDRYVSDDPDEWGDEEPLETEADGFTWYGIKRESRRRDAWVRRRLWVEARVWFVRKFGRKATDEESAYLTDELYARKGQLIVWQTFAEWSGKGYATGHWALLAEAAAKELEAALAGMSSRTRSEPIPEPPATEAHLDEAIAAAEAGLGLDRVKEPQAYHLVREELRAKHFLKGDKLRRTWPRLCRSCGEEFRPAGRTRRRLVNCDSCRGQKRAVDSTRNIGGGHGRA